jgi:acyl-CoA synthetase (AMP-forming)/AMP-acid ligase II
MSLIEALSNMPRDHVVVSGSLGNRAVKDLLQYAEKYGERVRGYRVILMLQNPVELIENLVALDGNAEVITLVPADTTTKNLNSILKSSGCNLVVGGVGHNIIEPLIQVESLPCFNAKPHIQVVMGEEKKTTWQLVTSGTTGAPKIVAHTLESLCRTVRGCNNDGMRARWGLLYDHTRFAGVQVILQSILSGSTLIATDSSDTLSNRIAALALQGCTHLSATPTLWRNILMIPGSATLPLYQITLGGEIADNRILAALRGGYTNSYVTHIYASTEAGVGFSVKDGLAGFPVTFLESPPAGIALRIRSGCLQIRNTRLTSTYVGTSDKFCDEEGWIETGDSVEITNERVYFLGRASGIINVGGSKVYPEEIERLLIMNPVIRSARVSGRRSSVVGTVVVADIIPAFPPVDAALFRAEIRSYLQPKIPSFKVPQIINIVDEIETNAAGKIKRGKSD